MQKQKIPSDIILRLNEEAKLRKRNGEDVTNGTIGMMFLDDGCLPISKRIREVVGKHTTDEDLGYSSVAGEPAYREGLIKWFFGDSFKEAYETKKLQVLGTMGGTGAVSISIQGAASKEKTAVLIPSLCWPNYPGICATYKADCYSYNLFKEGHFDIDGLFSMLEDKANDYPSVALLINDPCENPTGYCLTPEEWDSIVKELNVLSSKTHITLIIDCAYIDFADESSRQSIVRVVKSLDSSIIRYICMSFSKTFSFYGLRIGALATYNQETAICQESFAEAIKGARALWSVPNHMASNAIGELLSNPSAVAELKEEVATNREVVSERAKIFLSEAEEVGLEYYPFSYGFFVSIPCDDALAACEKLKNKNIFLAPVAIGCIRVSLSCLPTKQIYGLAKEIKEAI